VASTGADPPGGSGAAGVAGPIRITRTRKAAAVLVDADTHDRALAAWAEI